MSLILPDHSIYTTTNAPVKKAEKEIPNLFMMSTKQLEEHISKDPYFPQALNFRIALTLPLFTGTTPSGSLQYTDDDMDQAYVGNNIGRVVSIGGTVGGTNNSFSDCRDLVIGDYVQYNPHAGYPYFYSDCRFLIVEDQSIIQRLINPKLHTDGIFKAHKVRGLN